MASIEGGVGKWRGGGNVLHLLWWLERGYMGQYYQGVEKHFLGHFAWCIARLVAHEKKLVKQIFCLQILKLSDGSLHNK